MCRMLGIISNNVPAELMFKFRDLAKKGHKDGWGIAGFNGSKPEYYGRSSRNILKDSKKFKSALSKLRNSAVTIFHIREASRGMGKNNVRNNHPFIYNKWVFCHNGTIYDCNKIKIRKKLEGTTDSEIFFKYILENAEKSGSIIKGIKKSVEFIHNELKYTAMSFLLTNGKILFGFKGYKKAADSYNLYYSSRPDAFVICSEPLKIRGLKWIPLKNRELLISQGMKEPICKITV